MLLASAAFGMLASPALAADDDTTVDELIVTGSYTTNAKIDTATGLGLSVRETPQSVTVITAQRILDQNLDSIADVVLNAPGVTVNEVDDVRNTFNARGFEINNYQIDGVPTAWTLAGGAGETVTDASIYERIEIVRGATGLLTGAGDPSASINLVRKHANARTFQGYVSAGLGSWENRKVEADLQGPLFGDGAVRGRVVAKYQEGDNFIDLYHDKKVVLYGVIDADLGDATRLSLGGSHQHRDPTSPAWGALPSFFTDGGFALWPRSKTATADWTYWKTTNQNLFANLEHDFGGGWTLKANYNWLRNAENTQILYISGQVDRATGLGLGSYPFSDDGDSAQNSFDVQLKGRFDLFGRDHDLVVGALRSRQHLVTDSFAALAFPVVGSFYAWDGTFANPGFSPTPVRQVDQTVRQTGVYAAARLNVTDQLNLIAGGRISKWTQKGFNYSAPFSFGDSGVFTPYLGVLFDLTKTHRLYASYTEIFQPQNAQDRTGDFLAPVTGKAYEAGIKSAFFGDRLQTSAAIFRIEQDNIAQPDPTGALVPGKIPPSVASVAARGTVSKGVEFEVNGQPLPGWNISLGYSVFDATDVDGANVNTDHPRQVAKLFTTYELSGALEGLTIGGGVNWRSKNYTNALNPVTGQSFRLEQKAFALVSLMARYRINEQISVQANVENLTDETYFSQIGFYDQYRFGQPRNYSVSLKYAF